MNRLYLILIYLLIISCEQNEIAIDKHPMGAIEIQQISMESDYRQQIFYNLENNNPVSNNIKTEWDLAFLSSVNESKIIINSSTFSQVSILENHSFENSISIADLTWSWDNPKGIYYPGVFENIQSSNTYILDRGYNIDGSSRGYRKIRIDSINNNSYFITYAGIDNTNTNNIEIKKNDLANFQYFSFDTDSLASVEPDKNNWDLLFTQYTHLFTENIETPAYLVTGVLTNYLNNVLVAKDSINTFEEINLDMINMYEFSNNQNEIGYDWKNFDFENQNYTVDSETTYIIKSTSSRYFKLHFIDFYNESGEKGFPKFEIQEL